MQSCWFAYYPSSSFDMLIAIALLDLKVPISLKPDWIQLCATVGWLINTVYHKRIQRGGKLKRARGLITSFPEKEGSLYQTVRSLFERGVNILVNFKTAQLLQGKPQAFDWRFALYSLWKQPFLLTPCRCKKTFREELLRLSDKKFHNEVKSVWNQVHEEPHKVPFTNCLEWQLLCLIFCYTRGC